MPFRGLQTKARNDPLGPGGLVQLSSNLLWVRQLAEQEHIVGTGEHNAWQVPRRCFNVAAAGTSVTPSTGAGDVPTATRPATGSYTLTLAANRFSTNIRPQLNVNDDIAINKPCVLGYNVASATSISFYLKQLSSALGAGNTWAAANGAFDVALHSDPLQRGTYSPDQLGHARGDTLTSAATDWNALVQAHGDMQSMMLVAHSSVGVHAVAEVAKHYANVYWDGAAYKVLTGSSGITSVTRVSTGVVTVVYTALVAPQFAFVSPDYQRNNGGRADDIFIMHARRNSTTQHTVYIYKYDGANWNVAEADFFIAIHGS